MAAPVRASFSGAGPMQPAAHMSTKPVGRVPAQGKLLRPRGRIGRVMRSTKTLAALVALGGLMLATVFGLNIQHRPADHPIQQELFKFSLTVLIGGVIAFVFRLAEAKRQVRELRQRDLRDFYKRMLDAYNKAKRARRLLLSRTHAVKPAGGEESGTLEIARRDLDELMAELQSVQLDFEALRREAEVNTKLFPDHSKVRQHLRSAEAYLRRVLKVHERIGRSGDMLAIGFDDAAYVDLICFYYDRVELEKRRVPSASCHSFNHEFADQVHAVRQLIVSVADENATED